MNKKLVIRIGAIVLAVLMTMSVVVMLLQYLYI